MAANMAKIKPLLGYLLAGLAVPLVMAMFINMNGWMRALMDAGLHVSPWYTGGAVAFTIQHEGYATRVHNPVFLGLIGETREGFVQVDWTPKINAPSLIDEAVDYDADGRIDFRVRWDTQTGEIALYPYAEEVLFLESKYALREAWTVRVRIKNSQP